MKNSVSQPETYLAYLVRLWKVDLDEHCCWRVSIEDPFTGERHGFANVSAFIAFLMEKTEGYPGPDQER